MDWDNYNSHEHAKDLIKRGGVCDAPSGGICKLCFTVRYGTVCRKDTAYEAAKKFLKDYKIKSIWQNVYFDRSYIYETWCSNDPWND